MSARCTDQRHRCAQLLGDLRRIDRPSAPFQFVAHVEDDQRRQTQPENRRGESQVARQIGRVYNQQHCFRPLHAEHCTRQHVARDLLVFGPRVQAIDPRQIDQIHRDRHLVLSATELQLAPPLIHRHAGIIRHLLAQSGQAVEQRRLARVGRAH